MSQPVRFDLTDPGSPRPLTGKYKKPQPKKKSIAGGVIGSAIAVLIILFTMGCFPQVGEYFAQANANLQSHNDAIVAGVVHYLPPALIAIGVCGLLFLLLNKLVQLSNKRPAA